MGHDAHFLSRLDRVNRPTVEFALGLYRDAELVRALLDSKLVPAGAERVAICLGDGDDGPWVVVARDGHFVTCLGEGMYPRGLPVLPRSTLDALSQRFAKTREMRAQAERQAGRHGELARLVERIYSAGEFLGREEAVALRFWAPTLFKDLWEFFLHDAIAISEIRASLVMIDDITSPRWDASLRAYFSLTWAVKHLAAIVGDCELTPTTFEYLVGQDRARTADVVTAMVRGVFLIGTAGAALRASWLAARLGRYAIGPLKAATESGDGWTGAAAVFGLLGIASRRARYRAEVVKHLRVAPSAPPLDDSMRDAVRALGGIAAPHADRPDLACAAIERYARVRFYELANTLPAASPFRVPSPDAVPPDMLAASLVDCDLPLFPEMRDVNAWLCAAALVAPASFDALYFPQAMQAGWRRRWDPARAARLLEPHRIARRLRTPRPVRREAMPGRNDPCACGSGKKYKRCCAV